MSGGVARLEETVPLLHFGLIQSGFPEHGDPIVYVYVFIHM